MIARMPAMNSLKAAMDGTDSIKIIRVKLYRIRDIRGSRALKSVKGWTIRVISA